MPKLEAMAMVPIMRLRRRKRTVGVSQLFMEAQIEGRADTTESSNMAFGGGGGGDWSIIVGFQ